MARARINADGTGVRLGLSFREAAALRALLLRVGAETNEEIDAATVGTYFALDDVRTRVMREDERLWPKDYNAFAARESALVDEEMAADD